MTYQQWRYRWFEDFLDKRSGRLITVTRNSTDNTRINRTKIVRKQIWEEKNFMVIFSNKQATPHTKKLGRR